MGDGNCSTMPQSTVLGISSPVTSRYKRRATLPLPSENGWISPVTYSSHDARTAAGPLSVLALAMASPRSWRQSRRLGGGYEAVGRLPKTPPPGSSSCSPSGCPPSPRRRHAGRRGPRAATRRFLQAHADHGQSTVDVAVGGGGRFEAQTLGRGEKRPRRREQRRMGPTPYRRADVAMAATIVRAADRVSSRDNPGAPSSRARSSRWCATAWSVMSWGLTEGISGSARVIPLRPGRFPIHRRRRDEVSAPSNSSIILAST